MTDVFLFGTYYSYNENLDPSRTANREAAKWRSQFKVPQGSTPYGDVNDWWYIGGNVHLIDISDLDYQLKIKEIPFNSNADWIKRVEGVIRVDENYIGINPVVNFFYTDYQPPAETNPNPEPFPARVVSPKPYLPPSFIDFAEERLDLGYNYGAVGGMEFKTQIIEVADDREQRQVTRLLPLGRWQLGDRLYAESEVDKLSEVSYLKEFHTARLGKKQGFRFKDWSDYKAENQLIGIGDGETSQWQLSKAYKAGNATTYRPIQKPVVGTVDIFVDGVNVAVGPDHLWVVDHETGVISNEAPLLNGTVLSVNFEFDVPVWFESDELPLTLEKFSPDTQEQYYKLGSVFVVEGRIPFAIPWKIESPPEISEDLDLGIIYQTVEKYRFSTNILALKSGYTQRESKREEARILFDLGDRNYDAAEVEKILGYFWNARGQGLEFPLINLGKNYKVRFNQDQINFKFQAASVEDKLYQLSSLKLQAVPSKGFLDSIDPQTFVYIFVDTSGSMDSSIPTINQAIENLKTLLVQRVYGTVEAMEAKVIRIDFSQERWLALFTTYYASKAVYLIWINEAAPTYHSGSIYAPPTASFSEDLASYLATYADRQLINSIIYSINFNSGNFIAFQNHLKAAYEGEEGYSPALKNYRLQLRLNVPETTAAEEYFADFTGQQVLGDFNN